MISSVNVTKWETAELVTFTEEILNGKLHFCAVVFTYVRGEVIEGVQAHACKRDRNLGVLSSKQSGPQIVCLEPCPLHIDTFHAACVVLIRIMITFSNNKFLELIWLWVLEIWSKSQKYEFLKSHINDKSRFD